MKALAALLGVGVLVAGGVVLARSAMADGDTVILRRGGAYKFFVQDEATTQDQMADMGWASITIGPEHPGEVFEVQAIWVGADNYVWRSPEGFGNPVFLGMVTERESTSDVPMQGPSQTTNQSSFLVNFPAQGLVNLDE